MHIIKGVCTIIDGHRDLYIPEETAGGWVDAGSASLSRSSLQIPALKSIQSAFNMREIDIHHHLLRIPITGHPTDTPPLLTI